jgi:dolichol-phosphate mannosyltransferase
MDFAAAGGPSPQLELAVIVPTYNERENIAILIERLSTTLEGIVWEVIFVDDDSPDGTAEVVAAHAARLTSVRLIHRTGKRGLASACIEGMLATNAPCVAVMDADLQHDETILPRMLARLQDESLDVIVATRNSQGGSMGEFNERRVLLSRIGQQIGHAVCRCKLSDPMSGFFLLRRDLILEVAPRLKPSGFKILVDILATSRRTVRIGEVGYTFGQRLNGESKLDVFVGVEYLSLILNKLAGGLLPPRISLFLLVGSLGVVTHMLTLTSLLRLGHVHFVAAQVLATFVAMTGNFYFNNTITFHDRRLRGAGLLSGAVRFFLACSFAAWANVHCAHWLWKSGENVYVAGLAGILIGSAWNLSVSSRFTWGIPPHAVADARSEATGLASEGEVLF